MDALNEVEALHNATWNQGMGMPLTAPEENLLQQKKLDDAAKLVKKREALMADPFDPRTEVSADARKIVFHMWMILVVLPFALFVLYLIVTKGGQEKLI